jgi:hypothetical protein
MFYFTDELTALRNANEINKDLVELMADAGPHDPHVFAVAKQVPVTGA